jgi:hypothetical protein
MRILGGLVVVLVAACGHAEPRSTKPVTPAAPPPAPETARAEPETVSCANGASAIARGARGEPNQRTIELLTRRCTDDQWSQVALRCFVTARDWDEGYGCEAKMTKAQLDALEKDLKAQGWNMGRPPPMRTEPEKPAGQH